MSHAVAALLEAANPDVKREVSGPLRLRSSRGSFGTRALQVERRAGREAGRYARGSPRSQYRYPRRSLGGFQRRLREATVVMNPRG